MCTSESLRSIFSVPKSSQGILLCTQKYKMHSYVISSDFFCVHKSAYWDVVNTREHQQFYCVSCGGINNLIWIFSLHFDIRYEYFKALSGDKIKDASDSGDSIIEHDTDVERETTNLFEKEILDILDRVISIDGVRRVIRNMKNGKAAGLDKIIPELLKYVDDNFLDLMTLILNKIFDSGKFPEEWAPGAIVILFKEGTKSDLNNYRGITLLSMLGKISQEKMINFHYTEK